MTKTRPEMSRLLLLVLLPKRNQTTSRHADDEGHLNMDLFSTLSEIVLWRMQCTHFSVVDCFLFVRRLDETRSDRGGKKRVERKKDDKQK